AGRRACRTQLRVAPAGREVPEGDGGVLVRRAPAELGGVDRAEDRLDAAARRRFAHPPVRGRRVTRRLVVPGPTRTAAPGRREWAPAPGPPGPRASPRSARGSAARGRTGGRPPPPPPPRWASRRASPRTPRPSLG